MLVLIYRLRLVVRALHAHLLWWWFRQQIRDPLSIGEGTTLVVAPHPDDETIGCGGLIALKRERQVPVSVVYLTDGRLCLGPDYPDKEALALVRRQEAVAAAAILGVTEDSLTFLDLPDGGLGHLTQDARQAAVQHVATLIETLNPAEVLVPYHADCHDDHVAAFSLVQDALKRVNLPTRPGMIEYLIWGVWEAPLFRPIPWRVSGKGACLPLGHTAMETKRRAVAAYPSQLKILPKGFVKEHLRSPELYFKS